MPAPFIFEELTLRQSSSLETLYALYCRNFPLPDEQESFLNFLRCLELNADTAVQRKYGPYYEYYLTIRQYDENTGRYDAIVGGLIFGVCSSPVHIANGYLCSAQVIYLFRTASEGLRRFLYAGKAELEAEIETRARQACGLPRFLETVGADPPDRVAMFFEVNNPGLMSPAEIQLDRDLSQVHPALRHVMWTNHHTRPLVLRYVQPPLSPDQQSARYLDLFVVMASREQTNGGARLSVGPNGERGVPGPMLAEHLRCFFRVSVLKGDETAINHPCLPPPFLPVEAPERELLTVEEYCDAIAAAKFVPVVSDQDPDLKRIKAQAIELSVTTTRMMIHQAAEPSSIHWFGALLPRAKHWMELIVPFLATALLVVASVGELAGELLHWHLHIPGLHGMEVVVHLLDVGLAAIIFWFGWRAFSKRREQRRTDRSPTELAAALHAIRQNVPTYGKSHSVTILRDVLSDRAAHHLRAHILLEGADQSGSGTDPSVLSQFVASRTLTPQLADLRLSGFNRGVEQESGRIEKALRLYSAGVMQTMYRKTPWHAYYTCVFPVLPRVLHDEGAYARLSDFDRWIDADVLTMLGLNDTERERRFIDFHKEGGEVCLFVSHIVDLPWDESDPGSPPDFLLPSRTAVEPPAPTILEELIGWNWSANAELACGRMLAVIAHLASIMRLMAGHRQITTDMFCRCTVIMHVTAPPTIVFLRSLGFDEIVAPRSEAEGEPDGVLGGTLLECKIVPGAFANLLTAGKGATAAFFGLINEVARNIRDSSRPG